MTRPKMSISASLFDLLKKIVRHSVGEFNYRRLSLVRHLRKDDLPYVSGALYVARNLPDRECPLCGFVGKFIPIGPRYDAQCPQCHSSDRGRLLYLYLARDLSLPRLRNIKILHFAPEVFLRPLLEKENFYITSDLSWSNVDVNCDMTLLPFPDESFDLIICSHVLEHISDDKEALNELLRILKPGARAVLLVPIAEGWEQTYQDESIITDEQREFHYGRFDHARYYGRDFVTRLKTAGFDIRVFQPDKKNYAIHGLVLGDKVFECIKLN